MSGVAWLVLTEGERDDFMSLFLCVVLLLKQCVFTEIEMLCVFI